MVTPLNSGPMGCSCYSFCMCPGQWFLPVQTRQSSVSMACHFLGVHQDRQMLHLASSKNFEALNFHGPLAGLEFQRAFERRAATMGYGNFVLPVQTVTDFLDGKMSETAIPTSSYQLGIKAANLHDLFPAHVTEALQHSVLMLDKELPGFVSKNGRLHGVETRSSSPVQITRRSDTWESTSLNGLYPVGEGAGYAGGITSAAVDGMYSGFALAQNLGLYNGSMDSILGKAQTAGFFQC